MSHWTADNISELSEKKAIVTGANSGLGFEVAKELAGKGCHVVMACRDIEKAQGALLQIKHEYPQASLELIWLDLANLKSIKIFADKYLKRHEQLDLLCNNAGVMDIPKKKTADGFEMQWGTNHLGHFALTGLLMDAWLNTNNARVVTTSSILHHAGNIRFSDLNWDGEYNGWSAYCQSKLANLIFAFELQRRLVDIGSTVMSVAAHPGWAATNLQLVGSRMAGEGFKEKLILILNRVLAQSAEMGALPILYAATAPNIKGGDYIGPDRFGWFGFPKKVGSSGRSRDEDIAERLWEVSEELTGVHFSLS